MPAVGRAHFVVQGGPAGIRAYGRRVAPEARIGTDIPVGVDPFGGGGGGAHAEISVGIQPHARGVIGGRYKGVEGLAHGYIVVAGAPESAALDYQVFFYVDLSVVAVINAGIAHVERAVHVQRAHRVGDGLRAYGHAPVPQVVLYLHALDIGGLKAHDADPADAGFNGAVAGRGYAAGRGSDRGVDQAVIGVEADLAAYPAQLYYPVHRLGIGRDRGHRDRGAVLQFLGHYSVGHAAQRLARRQDLAFHLHFQVKGLAVGKDVPGGRDAGAEDPLRGADLYFGAGPAQRAAGSGVVDLEMEAYQPGDGGVVPFQAALVVDGARHGACAYFAGPRGGRQPDYGDRRKNHFFHMYNP